MTVALDFLQREDPGEFVVIDIRNESIESVNFEQSNRIKVIQFD